MQAPDIPDNEAQRIEQLRALNILDTASEERFDRVTRLRQAPVRGTDCDSEPR